MVCFSLDRVYWLCDASISLVVFLTLTGFCATLTVEKLASARAEGVISDWSDAAIFVVLTRSAALTWRNNLPAVAVWDVSIPLSCSWDAFVVDGAIAFIVRFFAVNLRLLMRPDCAVFELYRGSVIIIFFLSVALQLMLLVKVFNSYCGLPTFARVLVYLWSFFLWISAFWRICFLSNLFPLFKSVLYERVNC